MPNRADVAKLAGVSTATVSNVFNENKYVSPELRERVLFAAKQLSYFPVTREKNELKKIALVVDDVSNPHYGAIFRGMEEVASKNGVTVSMMIPWEGIDHFCKMLIENKMDGAFFTMYNQQLDEKRLAMYERAGLKIIYSWNNLDMNFDAAYMKAVQYLRDLGHRRIAYLSGLSVSDPTNARYIAFKRAMEANGLPLYPELCMDGTYPYETTTQSGYRTMKGKLETGVDFTAVVCLNDLMAIGAMYAICEKGLRIPEDISVIGGDDIPMAEFLNPPLTTIRIPAAEIGRRAMYGFIQKMRGETPQSVSIQMQLIVRQTTAACK